MHTHHHPHTPLLDTLALERKKEKKKRSNTLFILFPFSVKFDYPAIISRYFALVPLQPPLTSFYKEKETSKLS